MKISAIHRLRTKNLFQLVVVMVIATIVTSNKASAKEAVVGVTSQVTLQGKVWFWYPAEDSKKAPMKYADYEGSNDMPKWFKSDPLKFGASEEKLSKVYQRKTNTYLNATPKKGSFPLVVFAPGRTLPAYVNIYTYEKLVEAGYVVAAMDYTKHAQQATNNILSVASFHSFVDTGNVVLTGHSAGGLALMIDSQYFPGVKGLVSIDSDIGNKHGVNIARKSNYQPLNVPTMFMLSRWWRQENGLHQNFDDTFLKDCVVDFKYMDHSDFIDIERQKMADSGITFPENYNYKPVEAKLSYYTSVELVVEFVNYSLGRGERPKECGTVVK